MPWKSEGIATCSLTGYTLSSYPWNALKKWRDCDFCRSTKKVTVFAFFLKCPEKVKGLRLTVAVNNPYKDLKCPEKVKGLRPRTCGTSLRSKLEMPWKSEGIATFATQRRPEPFILKCPEKVKGLRLNFSNLSVVTSIFTWNALKKWRDCNNLSISLIEL